MLIWSVARLRVEYTTGTGGAHAWTFFSLFFSLLDLCFFMDGTFPVRVQTGLKLTNPSPYKPG
jgi:hypothetical protein